MDQANPNPETSASGWRKEWVDFARRLYFRFDKDRIMAVSAGVTFYAILAIFPALATLVSIYGLVADPSAINQHIDALRGVLPDGALQIISDQVKRLSAKGNGALGVTAVASLLFSLWSANSGVKAVFDALDIAYQEEEKRSFLRTEFVIARLHGRGVAVRRACAHRHRHPAELPLQLLGLNEKAWYIAVLRWPALLAVIMIGLATLYRYGPSRVKPEWRWVSWGSAVASGLWLVG